MCILLVLSPGMRHCALEIVELYRVHSTEHARMTVLYGPRERLSCMLGVYGCELRVTTMLLRHNLTW